MYKTTSSSLLRAASSRSPLLSSRSSLSQSSSSSAASASPSPPSSLLGRRSFATSSPAFRSLPRWSHCLHSRPSPFRLSSQIRAVSPGLDRLERKFSSMGNNFSEKRSDLASISQIIRVFLYLFFFLFQRRSIRSRGSSLLFLSLVVASLGSFTACLLSTIQGLVNINLLSTVWLIH